MTLLLTFLMLCAASDKFPILELGPTQIFVGMRVIKEKQGKLEKMPHDELKEYLKKNPVPVILAPNGKRYMIDHHHLSEAARRMGRENIFIELRHDWSGLKSMSEFWEKMKVKEYVFLFDEDGHAIKVEDLPTSVARLRDNPYRSLAYYVREAGGYRKTKIPFAEMKYAIFFKKHMKIEEGPYGFKKAIAVGYELARSEKAKHLPGHIPRGR